MPSIDLDDTIAAIATPPGTGGISVIRVSGPESFRIAEKIFVSADAGKRVRGLPGHTVHLGEIRDAASRTVDRALLTVFRSPNSYTGQDVVEISAHGGMTITRTILDLVLAAGARHAEPGEFTKRAFLNGKIDLTQAEAVIDAIHAKSARSLEIAMRQLQGSLKLKLEALKSDLMKMYAHMESFLDFPEEDIEIYSDREFASLFDRIESSLASLIASFTRGSMIREGVLAVILGKPNVGKSSLFNALLERDRALVSEYPGTTRDYLEESIEIEGHLVRLADTAGLGHDSGHPLDKIGMERTVCSLKGADWVIYVVDGSRPLEETDREIHGQIQAGTPVLVVVNKSDLELRADLGELGRFSGNAPVLSVSTKTGKGMDELEEAARDLMNRHLSDAGEGEQITRVRHKKTLEKSLTALRDAHRSFTEKKSLELVIVDLKASLDALRELVGEVYSEDLLDVVFSEFCIGK